MTDAIAYGFIGYFSLLTLLFGLKSLLTSELDSPN